MKKIILFTLALLFSTTIFSQADDCSTATIISSNTICSSPVVGTTAGATQSMVGCAGDADDDVWYKFIATSATHAISVAGSSTFSPVFETFSGSCGSLTSLDCNSSVFNGSTSSSLIANLTIGNTYYVRVHHYYAGSGSGSFTICLTHGTSPANDDCINAISLTSSTVCTSPVSGTSAWATPGTVSCAGNADDDVWYKFVAISATHSITVAGSSNYSPVFETFSGSCGSLISLDCISSVFNGGIASSLIANLTIGNTYYVRVHHYYAGSGSDTFTLCLTHGTSPANDDCANAVALTSASVCSSPVSGTSVWATPGMVGCSGNADDDVWYKFVATSATHSVTVAGSSNYCPVFETFSGSCGSLTSLDCNSSVFNGAVITSLIANLTIGNTYYVRVHHYFNGSGSDTFTICLTEGASPANDDCANAFAITSSSVCASPVAGTSAWATPSMPGCGGIADDDVWYKFVATATSQSIAVTGSANYSPVFELFSGNCGSLVPIDCNSNAPSGGTASGHYNNLVIGNTYYMRVYHYYAGSGSDLFTICLIESPAPANDDCSNAISISSTSTVCVAPVIGTSEFGNESMIGCAGNADDDVWYSFVASAISHSIAVTGSAGYDAVVEVFSGSCGSLTSLGCTDNFGGGGTEQIHLGNFTIGNIYYFRVYHYYPGSANNTFTICLTTPAVQPPANDDCVNAINLPVTPPCSFSNTIVNSQGATQSMPGCAGNADNDVWCKFVATNANQTINVTGDVGVDAVVQLFSGACGTLSSLYCSDNSGVSATESVYASNLLVGQTYYFRIYDYYNAGGQTFSVSVVTRELSIATTATIICLGNSVTLVASGTPTYTWSNGISNSVAFSPTATAIYTVSGVGTGSCINTATVQVSISAPQTPNICMITLDTLNLNNVIYWDKFTYTNIDSMIIYREVLSSTYQQIGAVDKMAFSRFVDTARYTGFRNGDPNIRSYKYKLQIRDTCGNYGTLSPYHTSLFLNSSTSTFTWDFYDIESQSSPVGTYELYRDDFNTGTFNPVGTVTATLGVNTYTITDPGYATYSATARWGIFADGFFCNPSFKGNGTFSPNQQINKVKSNVKNNFTIPEPPNDPMPVSVRELNLDSYVQIMPNPTTAYFNVVSAFNLQRVNIYSNLGSLVQTLVITGQTRSEVNVQELSNGIYSVEIICEKGRIVKKLVINR